MVDIDTPPRFSRLPEPLVGALRELARVKRLLIALDFDGTLAPEVDDPAQARALPEARQAVLRLLSMPNTRVALVSGRALASLEAVADLPDTALLVGSHGIEIRLDSPEANLLLDTAELRRVDVLNVVLGEVADSVDQVWLEPKPAGFALHTRLATDHNSRVAHLVARSEAAARWPVSRSARARTCSSSRCARRRRARPSSIFAATPRRMRSFTLRR